MEILFPFSIDKMKEEESEKKIGCFPIFINEFENLLHLLEGKVNSKPIDFGFNTVILVRNKKSKEKIPKKLSHLLCMTIYESKVNFIYYSYIIGTRI